MRPDVVRLGGFDSHTFPPPTVAVTTTARQPRSPRRAAPRGRISAVLAAALLAGSALVPPWAGAQQRDSLRAGAGRADTLRRAATQDTLLGVQLPRPPISPRRAFLTSFLLPGYAQARLERPTASAFFLTVEAASVLMLGKAMRDVRLARRLLADSVPATYAVDAATGTVRRDSTGAPIVTTWARGEYTTDLLRARRLQRE